MTVTRRFEAYGSRGAVASPNYLATQAGLRVFAEGGNAVDAVIATNAALTVVHNHQCGIGGDAFFLIRTATGDTVVANGSGRTPGALDVGRLKGEGHAYVPMRGPLAISVPGAVRAWGDVLARYGTLPLAEVLAPAIEYAQGGFVLVEAVAGGIKTFAADIAKDADSAATYLPGGKALEARSLVRYPDLARSLEAIAAKGPDALYGGEIGKELTDAVRAKGGWLSLADLKAHQTLWQKPLSSSYRGVTLFQCPPNSQGAAALMILAQLERGRLSAHPHLSAESIHAQVEAVRRALIERNARIADPDRSKIEPFAEFLKDFVKRADAIEADRHMGPAVPGDPDTVYLAAADAEGNVVSLIQSLYSVFGSCVMGGRTGIVLHNRAAFMPVSAKHINRAAPNVRPRHTLMPGMIEKDRRVTAWGTRGADGQAQTHTQIATAHIDYGLGMAAAMEAPRWRYGGTYPADPFDTLYIEGRVADEEIKKLRKLASYKIEVLDAWHPLVGTTQAATLHPDKRVSAATDPRSDGLAAAW